MSKKHNTYRQAVLYDEARWPIIVMFLLTAGGVAIMSPMTSSKAYAGINRRSSAERRKVSDRRNLIRYESIGCDRRVQALRRIEDAYWISHRS